MDDERDEARCGPSRAVGAFALADTWIRDELSRSGQEARPATQFRSNELVIEGAPVGSRWGWPGSEPSRHRAGTDAIENVTWSEIGGIAPAPVAADAEPGPAGALPLTREHLETWIERLRASHPRAQPAPSLDRHRSHDNGGPARRIPDRDMVSVGRRVTVETPSGAIDPGATPRLTSVVGGHSRTLASSSEGASQPGSSRRTVVLSVILALSLIWMAFSLGLFSPRPIEIPTTLNTGSRIT